MPLTVAMLGAADAHGKPEPGAECMTTFEDIDESNYVECDPPAATVRERLARAPLLQPVSRAAALARASRRPAWLPACEKHL